MSKFIVEILESNAVTIEVESASLEDIKEKFRIGDSTRNGNFKECFMPTKSIRKIEPFNLTVTNVKTKDEALKSEMLSLEAETIRLAKEA